MRTFIYYIIFMIIASATTPDDGQRKLSHEKVRFVLNTLKKECQENENKQMITKMNDDLDQIFLKQNYQAKHNNFLKGVIYMGVAYSMIDPNVIPILLLIALSSIWFSRWYNA
jgi:hypothetical protein